ncbi:hypothetical protein C8Q70DRAFT_648594 [Cubamyces menziesii]|nr:hypothetical protein C8Q70DRAFT_648594 [Cubamyces menziesii]
MYRPPSPVYDVPELPTLRRVKPLPKRRRTSGSAPHDHLDSAATPGSGGGGTPNPTPNSTTSPASAHGQQQDSSDGHTTAQDGEDGVPPSTPSLEGHATAPPDMLTAQMALQAYYMPVLGGVRDLFKASPPDSRASTPLDLSSALAGLGTGLGSGNGYGYGYGYPYNYADSLGGGGGGNGGMPGAYMDGRDGGDDDESGEGDYVDHLQQPGNTKKRKVPANMSGSQHGHDSGSTGSGAEDEPADRAIPTGRERDAEGGSAGIAGGGGGTGLGGGTGAGLSFAAQAALVRGGGGLGGGRRGRLTRATFAGLQHKEMLRSRKRQLAAVLGALAHGDTLALDQALSASYPFVQTGIDYRSGAPVRVRLSRRREARLARAYKAYRESLAVDQPGQTESPADAQAEVVEEKKDTAKPSPAKPGKQKQQTKSQTQTQSARERPPQEQARSPSSSATTAPPPKVPSSEFTFVCHSATSDRLVATKEEVAQLHSRFEEELARQAAKAAEAAKQAAAAAAGSGGLNGPLAKRADRTKAGAGSGKAAGDDGKADPAQPGGAGAGTKSGGKSGKKKKRSALANASNPHHLRNYVPSRLPHSGPPNAQQAAQNAQNLLSPPPLRFLSAEIPPRRPRKKDVAAAGAGAGAAAPPPPPPPVAPATTLTNPAEEWICPFCEYQLFYGDEQSYHRAVRNRKKILRRRRRARERAAAAASGVAPAATAPPAASTGGEKGEREDAVLDAPVAVAREPAPSPGKAAKWKEGDRGGRGVQAAAHA